MYRADKPCKFGGRIFLVGETIPEELIAEGRAKVLEKYGTISYVEGASQEATESAQKTADAEGGANTHTATENAQNGVEFGLIDTATAKKNAHAKKQPEKKGGK